MSDMITIHDADFNIVSANEEAKTILKLPSLDATDAKCYEFYHGKNNIPDLCPSMKCLLNGEPATFEIFEPYLNMDLEIKVTPLYDCNNFLIGLMHVVKNMTKHYRPEQHNKILS